MTSCDESPKGKSHDRRDQLWGVVSPRQTSKIGCVNVCTMGSEEEGRAELAIRTVREYDLDVCGFSEARWTGSGKKFMEGYTVYWSGHEKVHRHGVAVAVKGELAGSVTAWAPVSERIMWVRCNAKNVSMTIVQCYAPTDCSKEEDKNVFYEELERVLNGVPKRDLLMVMGDFNARVGSDHETWSKTLGRYGIEGGESDNGLRLLDLSAAQSLCVLGTFFQHKRIHQYTWYQRGKDYRSQIDHILIRRRWLSSVSDTRVYRGGDFSNSDHRLLVSKLRLRLTTKRRPRRALLDVNALNDEVKARAFIENMGSRFRCLEDGVADPEVEESALVKALNDAASMVCGVVKKPRVKWLTSDVIRASGNKEAKYKVWLSTQSRRAGDAERQEAYLEYKAANKACLKATRAAKVKVVLDKARELEKSARGSNTRRVFQAVEELSGSASSSMDQLKDASGNLLMGVEERKRRWKEHFEKLLNAGLREIADVDGPVDNGGDLVDDSPLPTELEVKEAIKKLRNHKAAGVDGVYAEMLKAGLDEEKGGVWLVKWVHRVIVSVWECERVPEDWQKAILVPLYKGKGDKAECNNWRGISLLSVVGKVFAHVLLERMNNVVEGRLSEAQAGFRRGRGCADQIFSIRRVMEQAAAKQMPVYACFVDLKAAYDSVPREKLWEVSGEYEVPSKLCRLLRALYSNTKSAVRVEGDLTEWFDVNTGLRQGCLLSPMLFNIYIDHVLRRALNELETEERRLYGEEYEKKRAGIRIEYVMPDGRRLRGDLIEGAERVLALLYADDLALVSNNAESLKRTVMIFEGITQVCGLTINVGKTKQLITLEDPKKPKERLPEVEMTIRGERVERVKDFVYLGSMISETGGSIKDMNRRISQAAYRFSKLDNVWKQRGISLQTKVFIYKTTVMSTLLYGAESWTCTENEYARVNTFHTKKLRQLAGMKRDEISNVKLFKLTRMQPLENYIRHHRLRWAGHVRRMEDDRLPKKVLFGQVAEGSTKRGRPKHNWTDSLVQDCKYVNIPGGQWVQKAKDRSSWRNLISSLTSDKKK